MQSLPHDSFVPDTVPAPRIRQGDRRRSAMKVAPSRPEISELKPRIAVFGVGGGGGNAINNMIDVGLSGVEFIVANTDAQALSMSRCRRLIQLGAHATGGLGAGSRPEVGREAAEESISEIKDHLTDTHMCFVTAGMGG